MIFQNSTIPVLAEDVNLEEIANRPECEEYTGADLSALVREAAVAAFRELVLLPNIERSDPVSTEELKVYNRHFTTAFTKTKPSVNKEVSWQAWGNTSQFLSLDCMLSVPYFFCCRIVVNTK